MVGTVYSPSSKQISGEVGSMSQPARDGLIRTVLFPNHVMMSITGLALKHVHNMNVSKSGMDQN
jgi:hypothetical protein